MSGVSKVNSGNSQSLSDFFVTLEDNFLYKISFIAQEIITSKFHQEEDETLENFSDPVTFELMEDPVITSSGRSYERSTIENIINHGDGLEPFTREPLIRPLIPNRALKNTIEQWKRNFLLIKEIWNQIIRKVQKEECKEKIEMQKMREQIKMLQKQIKKITNNRHVSLSSSSSSVMAVASRNPRIVSLPRTAFVGADWKRYFGKVEEVPLSANIEEIMQSPCPIWLGQRVQDTHLLTLIPKTVDGQLLTLNNLGEFIKSPKGGGIATKYRRYIDGVKLSLGDNPSSESYWALMTKNVLPGSRNKSCSAQLAIIEDLKKRTGIDYGLPPVLGGVVSILMHHTKTGKRFYSNNPLTWTRCLERDKDGDLVAFGNFSATGLIINYGSSYDSTFNGIAGFRKL